MVTLAEVTAKSIGKVASSVVKPIGLSRGTLVTRDLDVTRRFLEDLLGMACVQVAPDHMLARHRSDRGARSYWVLDIRRVAEIAHPQRLVNHWGFMVASNADVDRAFALASSRKDEYGLKRVHPPKGNHGSYSFYFEDHESNWWEIECRAAEISYAASVAAGDPAEESAEAAL
jgi:catechol 2,3-dioxygenase-like lactoylglutathione lyase family enzyme